MKRRVALSPPTSYQHHGEKFAATIERAVTDRRERFRRFTCDLMRLQSSWSSTARYERALRSSELPTETCNDIKML
jgi:hypothetical protein